MPRHGGSSFDSFGANLSKAIKSVREASQRLYSRALLKQLNGIGDAIANVRGCRPVGPQLA